MFTGTWRLMLLGVDPRWRGRGVARALLLGAADHAATSGGCYVWGRARTSVAPLHEGLGARVVSGVYDLDGSGARVGMVYGSLG